MKTFYLLWSDDDQTFMPPGKKDEELRYDAFEQAMDEIRRFESSEFADHEKPATYHIYTVTASEKVVATPTKGIDLYRTKE